MPVLNSPGYFEKPITDSLDITFWLCNRYPALRPAQHAAEVTRLLKALHAINFFSLSMRSVPERATIMQGMIKDKMSASGISEKYRKALEYKMEV